MVIDTALTSENPLLFRKDLLERILKLIMTIDDKFGDENYMMILTEKQQKYWHYLSSGKIDKYGYIAGK